MLYVIIYKNVDKENNMNDLIIHYDDEMESEVKSKKDVIPKGYCGIFAKGLTNKQVDILKYNGFMSDKSGYMLAPICDRNNDLIKSISLNELDAFMSPKMIKFYKVKDIQKMLRDLKGKVKNNNYSDKDFIDIIRYIEDNEIDKKTLIDDVIKVENPPKLPKNENKNLSEEKSHKRHRRTKSELIACGYYK